MHMKKIFVYLTFILFIIFQTFPQRGASQLGFGSTRSAGGNFSQYLMNTAVDRTTSNRAGNAKAIVAFNNAPNTNGKQFFSDQWMAGDSIIDVNGAVFSGDGVLFNFDKVSGSLIASSDKINLTAVDKRAIKSFVLIDQSAKTRYIFRQLPQIEPEAYFLELVHSPAGLSLYKKCIAVFEKADFRSDGITQQGSRDDKYVDKSNYYLFNEQSSTHEMVPLKVKSITSLSSLEPFAEKLKLYTQSNKRSKADEEYLIGMVRFIGN
jgi:hypothetical protein